MSRRSSSSRGRRCAFVAFAVAIAASSPTFARADESPDDALVQRGLELRRRGEDGEALRLFEQAYAVRPSPRVRAQIALAHQALGAWIEAEAGLLLALAATDDAWVARNHSALESALASVQRHLAWLEVAVNVHDARVRANGVILKSAPGESSRVVAGVVVLDVGADGYESVQRRLDIAAGVRAREVVTLAPAVFAPTSTDETGATMPRPSTASSPTAPSGDARRVVAWITAGGAVVFLATGIVATVARENLAGVYVDDSRCFYGSLSREERCGSYRQSAQSAQWVAIGAYALSGIAAATSAYLFFTMPSTPRRTAGALIRCAPGALAIGCSGEF